MNNERIHPAQSVPPIAHALHHWDASARALRYEYNGQDIVTLTFDEDCDVGFRHGSDGCMQSMQYVQQIYVSVEHPTTATLRFCLTEDAICMRPHRAKREQAILGQIGRPLMEGVNGLYDVTWDLLLDWHGTQWHWNEQSVSLDNQGHCVASVRLMMDTKPLYLNIRPQYYRKHLGYAYHMPWLRKPKQKAVAGWCSWEAYRRDIDAEKIQEISTFMEAQLKAYGLEYIQVDDGYQKMPLPARADMTMAEGWLTCEPTRFPNGHEGIVQDIRQHGLIPAVWTNANITSEEFAKSHADMLIQYEGELLKGEWIDYLYDCSPKTLSEQVEPLFSALRKLGYGYVKIDAIRHLLLDGLHECVRLGMMANEEAQKRFRAYMEATRKGLGEEAYYLASWGEMGEVIGVVDACRISMDANPTWAGIRMQLFESARWFHTQRILYLNDPDHVCIRTKAEWAKTVLSLVALSGELHMTSDVPEAYTEEKLNILRKTLPPLTTRTAETGTLPTDYPAYTWTKLHGFAVQSHETPVEMEDVSLADAQSMAGNFPTMNDKHPFSTLWAFHLANANRNWCVMARIATMPLEASKVSMGELGLNANKTYVAFDFWQEKFLGLYSASIPCDALGLGYCQIISLYEATGMPQVIASDRHVSMDAVSILEHSYSGNCLKLRLNGISATTQVYHLHTPQKITSVKAENCTVSLTEEKEHSSIRVHYEHKEATVLLLWGEVNAID